MSCRILFNPGLLHQIKRECLEWCHLNVGASQASSVVGENRFKGLPINRALEFWIRVQTRGFSHALLGDRPKAIEDFTEAIYLRPVDADTFNDRGNNYAELGDYRRAVKDFTEAIRLRPDDPDIFYNRGLSHAQLSDRQKAIEDFTEATYLGPDALG